MRVAASLIVGRLPLIISLMPLEAIQDADDACLTSIGLLWAVEEDGGVFVLMAVEQAYIRI